MTPPRTEAERERRIAAMTGRTPPSTRPAPWRNPMHGRGRPKLGKTHARAVLAGAPWRVARARSYKQAAADRAEIFAVAKRLGISTVSFRHGKTHTEITYS